MPAEYHLLDKANLLTLTRPEMTVLVGGLRVLGANWDGSPYGVFTERPGVLTNDFFVNLLDLGTTWKPLDLGVSHAFAGVSKDGSGEKVGVGTRVDLLFGSNLESCAPSPRSTPPTTEREKFVRDFVLARGPRSPSFRPVRPAPLSASGDRPVPSGAGRAASLPARSRVGSLWIPARRGSAPRPHPADSKDVSAPYDLTQSWLSTTTPRSPR